MTSPFRNIEPARNDRLDTLAEVLASLEATAYSEKLFNSSLDTQLERGIFLLEGAGSASPFDTDPVLPDLRRPSAVDGDSPTAGGLIQQTEDQFSEMQRAMQGVLENPDDFPISARGGFG